MSKIAVISMVKNEADIIEHFVRHCLSFADMVLIMDHDSCDGTSEILSCLRDEDNRLIIYKCDTMGHIQSEVMTSLMKEAALKYNADIVVPLDADEFLLTRDNSDVRTNIMSLSKDSIYSIPYDDYTLDDNKMLSKKFILNCSCKLVAHGETSQVIIAAGNWNWQNMRLVQGNHLVLYSSHNGLNPLATKVSCNLYFAHFPKRSHEQQLSKFIIGWIQNVAKYTRNTYYGHIWGRNYDAIIDGSYNEEEEKKAIHRYDKLQDKVLSIKYSNLSQVNPLRNLQITAEKMANKIAINECLLAGNKADVIILSCDTVQKMGISLESIRAQKYAVDKVFIVTKNIGIMQELKNKFKDLCIIVISDIYEVKKLSTANYLQLMLAGDEMQAGKVSSAMAIMYKCPDFDIIYSNGNMENEKAMDFTIPDEDRIGWASGRELLNILKNDNRLPSGGIVGFLFKKHLLADIDYMRDHTIDGKPLYWLGTFNMILQCSEVGVIHDRLVKSVAYTDDIVNDYMIQLQVVQF